MVDKEKRKNHGFQIYKKYTISEIFTNIDNGTLPDNVVYGNSDFKDSLRRARIIKELIERDGLKCLSCGVEASNFALGKDKIGRWHLDLYTEDMEMLTIDHVHPKSKGGKDEIDNFQLLCKICNEDKSDHVIGNDEISEVSGLVIKKTKRNKFSYLDRKLSSLSVQIKGIFDKVKRKDLICIKENDDSITVGKEYTIIDIGLEMDDDYNTSFVFLIKNDEDTLCQVNPNIFITKTDYYTHNQ